MVSTVLTAIATHRRRLVVSVGVTLALAKETLHLSLRSVSRCTKDVLIREYTLDNAARALDGLEETRADWHREDERRLSSTSEVLHLEIELKREVTNKTRSLARLESKVTAGAKN